MRGFVMVFNSIGSLLNEWGMWSNAGLGLTLNAPSDPVYIHIDDDTALIVDAAIALLGTTNPKTKAVVMLHYRSNQSTRSIACKLGIGKTKAGMLLSSGEAWLEGNLIAQGVLIQKAA